MTITIRDNITLNITIDHYYTIKVGGENVFRKQGKEPSQQSPNTAIGKEICKYIDDGGRTREWITTNFSKLMLDLDADLQSQIERKENEVAQQEAMEEAHLQENVSKASAHFSKILNPLIYIASLVDWFTAGERYNIMLSWMCYCSQVILNEPISVIGLGESASGKSHVQQEALSMIPSQFITNEKSITSAALFNRANTDSHFYESKIVNYGDMGGANDQEYAEDAKALMKELQSDGELNKPISVKRGEVWETEEITLIGRPALTYTTVPNYKFDEQEKSRSIFITPRTDNKVNFEMMTKALEFKGTSFSIQQHHKETKELVKFLVYDLRQKLRDVEIINPYVSKVTKYLTNSKYYKRDFPKYNSLLKIITALNYYNRELVERDGKQYMFTTKEDVQLFKSILEDYKLSIIANLSPKSEKVLVDLTDNYYDYVQEEEMIDGFVKAGVTFDEYYAKSELGLAKSSIKTYFHELADAGFLEYKGRRKDTGHSEYALTDKALAGSSDDLELEDSDIDMIIDELGIDFLEVIEKDEVIDGLEFSNQHELIKPPKWSLV